jgi:hypothetical protein
MQSLSFTSPDGKHLASLEYEGEIRFGPAYYRLALDQKLIAGEVFGREALWSEDSRYLAVQLWLSTEESEGPQTALICFDIAEHRRCQLSTARDGFIVPKRFEGETLIYTKELSGRVSEYEMVFPTLPRWKPM